MAPTKTISVALGEISAGVAPAGQSSPPQCTPPENPHVHQGWTQPAEAGRVGLPAQVGTAGPAGRVPVHHLLPRGPVALGADKGKEDFV